MCFFLPDSLNGVPGAGFFYLFLLTRFLLFIVVYCNLEIYRIVSNKALESSGDVIRPTGGESINVAQPPDEAAAGKCC